MHREDIHGARALAAERAIEFVERFEKLYGAFDYVVCSVLLALASPRADHILHHEGYVVVLLGYCVVWLAAVYAEAYINRHRYTLALLMLTLSKFANIVARYASTVVIRVVIELSQQSFDRVTGLEYNLFMAVLFLLLAYANAYATRSTTRYYADLQRQTAKEMHHES